jgi:hypothetical protein
MGTRVFLSGNFRRTVKNQDMAPETKCVSKSTGFPDVASAGLLEHPAIRLLCVVVTVVITALDIARYVSVCRLRYGYVCGLKTQWL